MKMDGRGTGSIPLPSIVRPPDSRPPGGAAGDERRAVKGPPRESCRYSDSVSVSSVEAFSTVACAPWPPRRFFQESSWPLRLPFSVSFRPSGVIASMYGLPSTSISRLSCLSSFVAIAPSLNWPIHIFVLRIVTSDRGTLQFPRQVRQNWATPAHLLCANCTFPRFGNGRQEAKESLECRSITHPSVPCWRQLRPWGEHLIGRRAATRSRGAGGPS